MDVINRIQNLMDARGFSEYRLAKESSLHQSTIANIFRRNTIPSIATLSAICKALGITLSQFFDEADTDVPNDAQALLRDWAKLTDSQKALLQSLIDELLHK